MPKYWLISDRNRENGGLGTGSFDRFFDIADHLGLDICDHSMPGYERLVEQESAQLDQLFS